MKFNKILYLFVFFIHVGLNCANNHYAITLEFKNPTNNAIKKKGLNLKQRMQKITKKNVFNNQKYPHTTIMYGFSAPQKKVINVINKSINNLRNRLKNFAFTLKPKAKFFNNYVALTYDSKSIKRLKLLSKFLSLRILGSLSNFQMHASLGKLNYSKNNLTVLQKQKFKKLFQTISLRQKVLLSKIVLTNRNNQGIIKRVYEKTI